jgi:PAS domain S-box-containing protein
MKVEGTKSSAELLAEIERLRGRLAVLEAAEAKRERIEAELRTEVEFSTNLINALPLFFLALDSSGKPIMMNQVMLKALGYTPAEVLGVDYLSTFVSEEDAARVLSDFEAVTRHQASPLLSEYRMKTKTGQELLVEWRSRPVFSQDHQLDFIFSVGLDVTERRQVEQDGARLSSREREVLQLVGEGYTNGTIAQRLHISIKTVEKHRASIMIKLGVHDSIGMLRTAIKHGLIFLEK